MRGSLTREGRWGGASLTGKRSDFCVRKNPTEDASPAPGGTGLPREGRKLRARNWVGPVREAPVPPGAGEAKSAGVPHGLAPLTGPTRPARGGGDAPSRQGRGTPPSRVRLYERTYPPEGGERRSPIYIYI